jgi:hypothetical protein
MPWQCTLTPLYWQSIRNKRVKLLQISFESLVI